MVPLVPSLSVKGMTSSAPFGRRGSSWKSFRGELLGVHKDYLEAGSDCVTTASYQATYEGFMKRGSEEEAKALIQSSNLIIKRYVMILN